MTKVLIKNLEVDTLNKCWKTCNAGSVHHNQYLSKNTKNIKIYNVLIDRIFKIDNSNNRVNFDKIGLNTITIESNIYTLKELVNEINNVMFTKRDIETRLFINKNGIIVKHNKNNIFISGSLIDFVEKIHIIPKYYLQIEIQNNTNIFGSMGFMVNGDRTDNIICSAYNSIVNNGEFEYNIYKKIANDNTKITLYGSDSKKLDIKDYRIRFNYKIKYTE